MKNKEIEIVNVPLKTHFDSSSTSSNSISSEDNQNDTVDETRITQNGLFYCWNSTRYFILIISLTCFSIVWSNALVWNFTVICIKRNCTDFEVELEKNGSMQICENGKTSVFSKYQQGWLISAIAIGNFIGSGILSFASSKVGTRFIFTIYGFISAICTLLSPLAVTLGFPYIFAMRIGQGIANSIGIPGVGAVSSPWAPISSSGIFLSLLSTHLSLGPIFTMPLAGLFCDSSIGWPGIFYLQGGLTIAVFGIFFVLFRDSPDLHRNVSNKELTKIIFGKPANNSESSKGLKIPYMQIFTDKSVIGIIFATIAGAIGFQVFNQYGPIYLQNVLKMNLAKTGLAAALPYLCSLFVKIISGPISDKLTFLSQKTRVIMFASISQYGMAVCFILLAWMPFKSAAMAQILYTLVIVFSGVNCVGILKGITLQALKYSYFLLIISAFINNLVVLVLPLIISHFVPNDEWSTVFYAIGILLIICITIFNVTCETEPRPWTYPTTN